MAAEETTTVISKDKFKQLDVSEVTLTVIDYSYSLISHTEYEVQISIKDSRHYLKSTRYRHLEAFDHVLREKFKNLDFPRLPDKNKILNFKKEKERKKYLQDVLDLILEYSRRYPNLKSQLFSFLYNLLLKGELQVLKPEDVKTRTGEENEATAILDSQESLDTTRSRHGGTGKERPSLQESKESFKQNSIYQSQDAA